MTVIIIIVAVMIVVLFRVHSDSDVIKANILLSFTFKKYSSANRDVISQDRIALLVSFNSVQLVLLVLLLLITIDSGTANTFIHTIFHNQKHIKLPLLACLVNYVIFHSSPSTYLHAWPCFPVFLRNFFRTLTFLVDIF